MFEKHKAEKAAQERMREAEQWEQERLTYANMIKVAKAFTGSSSNELMLAKGEALFFTITNGSLVEDRRGPGHYQGGSSGISVPIGTLHGRSVRYRAGVSHGHYVQGTPISTAIDKGTLFVTNKRVIFQGAKQTRECSFAKLIGFQHDDKEGSTTFSVSNRQKPTTLHYGSNLSSSFDFFLDLAMAHYKGTLSDLVSQLQSDLAQIELGRPPAPAEVS